ncbi:MAG: FdtA/QdtA family cupin domain-containing protein [Haliea sp.]
MMKNKLVNFPVLGDERGSLIALEAGQSVPFEIKRVYYIYGTVEGVIRGLHAHHELEQMAICLSGSCHFLMDDGVDKEVIVLDRPDAGLLIPPMVWHEMSDFSDDCVLMVLANDHYDEADYIRNYDDFKNLVSNPEV